MPAPVAVGVYVIAALGTVAAGLAFKEFVYEPHIAPRVERWAEEFLAKRRARKMQRAGMEAVAVPSVSAVGKRDDDVHLDGGDEGQSTYELESLVAHEVRQWRAGVDVGRGGLDASGLRHRHASPASTSTLASALDESNVLIPYSPMTPTHVLFDPDAAASPTSTGSSRVPTPSPHSTLSHAPFRTPPPPSPPAGRAPPTPEPSVRGEPPADPFSGTSPVSLSLSHPLDLAREADLELRSAPSEPGSPFSAFSLSSHSLHSLDDTQEETFQSFALSPELAMRSVRSDSEADAEEWSNAGSEVAGSESSWASAAV
ncbi:hypothetical protein B0H17DRAFT_1022224 [Mycena rosella]|uniref:Uncharacterized protein n=1 Tax=Mycena rosella TaxID=1033263 RepID=A0AAD7CLW9_MYCRO|nr:hypothetical protein B0H17DRAFT_1022224 [Mycena rosella]